MKMVEQLPPTIDVVGIMDEACQALHDYGMDPGPLREARNAVEELIDTSEQLCRTGNGIFRMRAILKHLGRMKSWRS